MRTFALMASVAAAAFAQSPWQPLFDGRSLGAWKVSAFPGAGPAKVEEGAIVIGPGSPLAGVTWTKEFPRTNYELRYEARRVKGNELFAAVTFPAGESFATFVTGGFGGDIVGLSSIDGWDASENETRSYFEFELGRWYQFRVRVTGERIEAWIGDTRVVDAHIVGRTISLRRGDIRFSTPLGFASYSTVGAVRAMEYRLLAPRP